jgi:general secretion pathway protein D
MLQSEGQLTIGGETNAVNATAETDFPIGGDGFTYVINAPGRFLAQLRALATESRVKVLSDPHILVRNNQQAKINIGDSIPITRTVSRDGEDETTVEYKETGIILTVTPQINFEGDVVMAPPITKTTAETYLITQDGHPLVIGGLIRTTDQKSTQGVPLLKDIPLIGRLFRYNEQQSDRRELVILVTPRIVRTPEQGWTLTDDVLQNRIKRLEQLFNREETDPEKVERFLKRQFNPEEEQP